MKKFLTGGLLGLVAVSVIGVGAYLFGGSSDPKTVYAAGVSDDPVKILERELSWERQKKAEQDAKVAELQGALALSEQKSQVAYFVGTNDGIYEGFNLCKSNKPLTVTRVIHEKPTVFRVKQVVKGSKTEVHSNHSSSSTSSASPVVSANGGEVNSSNLNLNENKAKVEDSGNAHADADAKAKVEDSGNSESESKAKVEDSGNSESESKAKVEDSGNSESESKAKVEDSGNSDQPQGRMCPGREGVMHTCAD